MKMTGKELDRTVVEKYKTPAGRYKWFILIIMIVVLVSFEVIEVAYVQQVEEGQVLV